MKYGNEILNIFNNSKYFDVIIVYMKKKPNRTKGGVVVYKLLKGAITFRGDITNETIWASLDQVAELFGRDKSVISRHFSNIYKEGELVRSATVAKNAIVQKEGGRSVLRDIEFYNLDAIISVGYRVNSKMATQFRQWATKTLKQHITQGYTIDPKRVTKNYDAFMEAVSKVQSLLPDSSEVEAKDVLELVRIFADTWFTLDAYDKEELGAKVINKKKVNLTAKDLKEGTSILKEELIKKGEASENFSLERNAESIEGIVGNVMQSFGGTAMYPSVEGKAAHLLYFIIKNHPFVDGNKRSGAFAFVWFLEKVKVLNSKQLTPSALTALTILIAESNPADKEKMVSLVMALITKR
jgi:prophage maintenance system killer protein